ncbi:serine-rich adhesin for platelets-like [Ptychodera flava]|uniref:serine-rich adhesin for platelets-like n=1 Tax=Ptychodera flava TaxID=63121 RepID=UPI00396A7863
MEGVHVQFCLARTVHIAFLEERGKPLRQTNDRLEHDVQMDDANSQHSQQQYVGQPLHRCDSCNSSASLNSLDCKYVWEEAKRINKITHLGDCFSKAAQDLHSRLCQDTLTPQEKARIINFLSESGIIEMHVTTAKFTSKCLDDIYEGCNVTLPKDISEHHTSCEDQIQDSIVQIREGDDTNKSCVNGMENFSENGEVVAQCQERELNKKKQVTPVVVKLERTDEIQDSCDGYTQRASTPIPNINFGNIGTLDYFKGGSHQDGVTGRNTTAPHEFEQTKSSENSFCCSAENDTNSEDKEQATHLDDTKSAYNRVVSIVKVERENLDDVEDRESYYVSEDLITSRNSYDENNEQNSNTGSTEHGNGGVVNVVKVEQETSSDVEEVSMPTESYYVTEDLIISKSLHNEGKPKEKTSHRISISDRKETYSKNDTIHGEETPNPSTEIGYCGDTHKRRTSQDVNDAAVQVKEMNKTRNVNVGRETSLLVHKGYVSPARSIEIVDVTSTAVDYSHVSSADEGRLNSGNYDVGNSVNATKHMSGTNSTCITDKLHGSIRKRKIKVTSNDYEANYDQQMTQKRSVYMNDGEITNRQWHRAQMPSNLTSNSPTQTVRTIASEHQQYPCNSAQELRTTYPEQTKFQNRHQRIRNKDNINFQNQKLILGSVPRDADLCHIQPDTETHSSFTSSELNFAKQVQQIRTNSGQGPSTSSLTQVLPQSTVFSSSAGNAENSNCTVSHSIGHGELSKTPQRDIFAHGYSVTAEKFNSKSLDLLTLPEQSCHNRKMVDGTLSESQTIKGTLSPGQVFPHVSQQGNEELTGDRAKQSRMQMARNIKPPDRPLSRLCSPFFSSQRK